MAIANGAPPTWMDPVSVGPAAASAGDAVAVAAARTNPVASASRKPDFPKFIIESPLVILKLDFPATILAAATPERNTFARNCVADLPRGYFRRRKPINYVGLRKPALQPR